MKAQELRDKLAAIRNFTVLVDNKPVTEVLIDIAKATATISTQPVVDKKVEVKK